MQDRQGSPSDGTNNVVCRHVEPLVAFEHRNSCISELRRCMTIRQNRVLDDMWIPPASLSLGRLRRSAATNFCNVVSDFTAGLL